MIQNKLWWSWMNILRWTVEWCNELVFLLITMPAIENARSGRTDVGQISWTTRASSASLGSDWKFACQNDPTSIEAPKYVLDKNCWNSKSILSSNGFIVVVGFICLLISFIRLLSTAACNKKKILNWIFLENKTYWLTIFLQYRTRWRWRSCSCLRCRSNRWSLELII